MAACHTSSTRACPTIKNFAFSIPSFRGTIPTPSPDRSSQHRSSATVCDWDSVTFGGLAPWSGRNLGRDRRAPVITPRVLSGAIIARSAGSCPRVSEKLARSALLEGVWVFEDWIFCTRRSPIASTYHQDSGNALKSFCRLPWLSARGTKLEQGGRFFFKIFILSRQTAYKAAVSARPSSTTAS